MIKNKNVGKCFYERNISDVFALLEWKYERLFQNNIVECFFAFLYQQFAVCEQICSYFEVNVCDRFQLLLHRPAVLHVCLRNGKEQRRWSSAVSGYPYLLQSQQRAVL